MTEEGYQKIVSLVRDTLVRAGSVFSEDKKEAYRNAIAKETNAKTKWVMETILENAEAAERDHSPLCDDTGIPHILLDIGDDAIVTGKYLDAVKEGIGEGLKTLPGRPMAVLGDDAQRLDQSLGLSPESDALEPAPFLIRRVKGSGVRLHVLMFGGGPAIRGKTYRVFHRHSVETVLGEIISWAKTSVAELGCSPCTLAVGIGRSHYEAASMMLMAQADGNYSIQSEMEKEITDRVNEADIGALGLHGDTSVLATFLKVGPQRASGVRIVCMRPACCFEPRKSDVLLPDASEWT